MQFYREGCSTYCCLAGPATLHIYVDMCYKQLEMCPFISNCVYHISFAYYGLASCMCLYLDYFDN